ncbi:serine/threonine-protein kinase [Streptomyces sp. NBRC 109706]|uniref:serine/threonine-protein kinase n=1 Tax=Streptomyces sp. NBRC 109706 TaxID=1550035 RepID=UPI0007838FE7|nr:serine/threonine-protein kinase [Streptomyces sp. NBRC 109706]
MLEALTPHDPAWVGPYQLLARLGAGGMGEVYLARRDAADPGGELAAVKTMLPELGADHDFRTRFRRETAAARAVSGPYTTALLDADPDADPPWLATEYVPGPTLHAAVARCGPFPVPVVRRLGVDLARALAAVHGVGLVHRDVKPGNVLLGAEGPRLIDFGIARAADATALTATGMLVGSPGFMSPEQVRADSPTAAPSDVFCLGAVLCFAATGRSPFHDEETAAVLLRISRAQADLTAVPEELREILAACLRAAPDDRPEPAELVERLTDPRASAAFPWPAPVGEVIDGHAAELARVLAQAPAPPSALDTMSAPPGPPSVPGPAPEATTAAHGGRRRRVPLLLVGGAALAAAGGLLAGLLLFGGDSDNDRETAAPTETSDDQNGETGEGGENGDGTPAEPQPTSAEFFRNTFAIHPVTSEMRPFVALPAPTDPALRPEGWAPWQAQLDGLPDSCSVSHELISCLVDNGESRQVRVLNAANGEEITRDAWQSQQGFGAPTVSGGFVYLVNGVDVVRVRAVDDEVETVLTGPPGYTVGRVVVEGGVVYVSYFGDAGVGSSFSMLFRAFQEEDGERLWEREVTGAYPQSMRLAGGRIFLESGIASGEVLDAATGEPVEGASGACSTWLLADGLVYCSEALGSGGTGSLWDIETWEPLILPSGVEPVSGEHGIGIDRSDPEVVTARGLRTGIAMWTAPAEDFYYHSDLVATGDLLLASGLGQLDIYRLSDGELLGPPELPEDWLGAVRGGTAHDPLAIAHGGILHIFYQNGDVISTELPTG